MKKWIITLIAGYAAGLAVAMKFRKDAWTSKIPSVAGESKVEGFISEVVDIHRVAFDEAKKFFDEHLDDVDDFESLKGKVEKVVAGYIPEIENRIQSITAEWDIRKKAVLDLIEKSYGEKQAFLLNAYAKAERFVDTGSSILKSWTAEITKKLDAAYEKLKKDSQV